MTTKFVGALFVLAFLGLSTDGIAQGLTPQQQQQVLDRHNFYRDKHCVPPLTWDPELAAGAQQWADRCVFEHTTENYAESIAGAIGSGGAEPVDLWYSEIKDYSFSDPLRPRPTGHWIGIIWKGETKLGCGMAACPGVFPWGGPIWVCRYEGQLGDWEQNVLPPCK